jgi:hypothetical protein
MASDMILLIALGATLIVLIYQTSRIWRTSILHRSVREAIKADPSMLPILLERIDEPRTRDSGDDRIGLVLMALGAALLGFGILQGDSEAIRNLSGLALFPTFVGAVLFIRHLVLARRGAGR